MIKNHKKKISLSVFAVLAGFYISGCVSSPQILDAIPMEQVQQIETEKTTKRDIFNKFGPPQGHSGKR